MVVLGGRHPHGRIARQDDNPVIRRAYTDFHFGANHSETLHSANLGFLDGKLFFSVIERGAHRCHYHLLSCSHIGRTADDLQRRIRPHIYRGDMQMIRIRVFLTSQNMADDQTSQASPNRFDLFYTAGLQTDGSERVGYLLRREGAGQVLQEPFV